MEGCHPLGCPALGSDMPLSQAGGHSSPLMRRPCVLGDPRTMSPLGQVISEPQDFLCFIEASSQLSLPNLIFLTPSVSSTERLPKVHLGILRACLPGGCIAFLKFAAFAALILKSLHMPVCSFKDRRYGRLGCVSPQSTPRPLSLSLSPNRPAFCTFKFN